MTLSGKELEELAALAYLEGEPDTLLPLVTEVNAIIDFVQTLRQTDTKGIAPLFHPFDLHQRLRNDVVTEEDCLKQLADIAPDFEDGLYLVPKVIDSGK